MILRSTRAIDTHILAEHCEMDTCNGYAQDNMLTETDALLILARAIDTHIRICGGVAGTRL